MTTFFAKLTQSLRKKRVQEVVGYSATFFISTIATYFLLRLWRADITIPFTYSQDGLVIFALVKDLIASGSYFENIHLGAPFTLVMYDYPIIESIHFAVFYILGLIFKNFVLAVNVYYLLTYPLASLTSVYVFRRFNVSWFLAICGSLIFAFAPYHLLRGESHFFYSTYFFVPLGLMTCIWVFAGNPLFLKQDTNTKKISWNFKNREGYESLIYCAFLGCTSIYFSFFLSYLLIIGGIINFVFKKRILPLISSFILIIVMAGLLLLNALPNLAYIKENNPNTQLKGRASWEAELYALKFTHLFIPQNFQIKSVVDFRNEYTSQTQNNYESTAYLGLVGIIGFLLLILHLFKDYDQKENNLIHILACINIASFLLSTNGGIGSLVSYLVFSEIRAYNRISIFILFISILGVIFFAEQIKKRYFSSSIRKIFFLFFISIIVFLSLFEQTLSLTPHYYLNKETFLSDQKFIQTIEHRLPKKAMIYQMPYKGFPETAPIYNLHDYDLIKPYLHSENLHWSYASFKGREADKWHSAITNYDLPRLVKILSLVGFQGIYIDRNGYIDNAVALEKELENILKEKPIYNSSNTLIFFDMQQYNKVLLSKYNENQLSQLKQTTLNPIHIDWEKPLVTERGLEGSWMWISTPSVSLRVTNNLPQKRKVILDTLIQTGYETPSEFFVSGDIIKDRTEISSKTKHYHKVFDVPPGTHIITFKTDAEAIDSKTDKRNLIFRFINFTIREEVSYF